MGCRVVEGIAVVAFRGIALFRRLSVCAMGSVERHGRRGWAAEMAGTKPGLSRLLAGECTAIRILTFLPLAEVMLMGSFAFFIEA